MRNIKIIDRQKLIEQHKLIYNWNIMFLGIYPTLNIVKNLQMQPGEI